MFRRSVHQTIHFTCLAVAAFSMPVSIWLLSAVSITGAANWLLGGELRAKMRIFSRRRDMLILLSLFGMYLLWLANTTDFQGALHELKIKLPLLFFPVVIGSSFRVTSEHLRLMLFSFIAGCMVAVGAGYLALSGLWPVEVDDSRDLALFVQAIRLSILLNLGIFAALRLSLDTRTGSMTLRVIMAAAAAVMALFLFHLLSVTGVVIFIILLGGTGIYLALQKRHRKIGLAFMTTAAAAIAATVMLMTTTWHNLRNPDDPGANFLRQVTLSGNSYTHYPEESLLENGHLVWINVCEEELKKEWNRRSAVQFDSLDRAGNELRVTLIRYISYRGMPKDSAAISALSANDIENIERGFANPLYAHPGTPRAKAYELAWQADRALKGANPSGHSVAQRLEFYRAAAGIIKKNPWIGTGTGDVRNAYINEYNINNTPLTEGYRMRSHNQYLSFAVTFGIPGMVIALALMLIPWLISPHRNRYLFAVFISIIFLAMFNDDTFSSFTGATFFSYFYTLFLTVEDENENDSRG